jgi:ferric-dicitrate binding protein FerR (iron transport regulator)
VPADYAAGNRTVSLEGEALFVVAHDARHPFAVRAGDAVMVDVGTRFDVRAYGDDPTVRVGVLDGQVSVAAPALKSAALLSASDLAELAHPAGTIPGGITITHQADVGALAAWTNGTLVFCATPVRQVLRDLARTYAVAVTADEATLATEPFTATISNETLATALESVASAFGAQVERTGNAYRLTRREASMRPLP